MMMKKFVGVVVMRVNCTKVLRALREASISIACLLDDIRGDDDYLISFKLQEDIEHIQNKITIMEQYLDPKAVCDE